MRQHTRARKRNLLELTFQLAVAGLILAFAVYFTLCYDYDAHYKSSKRAKTLRNRNQTQVITDFEEQFRQKRQLRVNESGHQSSPRNLQSSPVRDKYTDFFQLKPSDLVREFSFSSERASESAVKQELQIYIDKQLESQADIDSYDYPDLEGTDFDSPEKRAAYFYTTFPPEGYYVDFPNPRYIKIMMRVDPCRLNGLTDLCCNGSNESVCEDNTTINSGTDIGIAWFVNGFVLHCEDRYAELLVCGTFIEIHKPNDPTIEDALEISKTYSSGFSTEFISTKSLCAGRYEFWWVVRQRNGSTLQYVKPFFSIYPSCKDTDGVIDQGPVVEEEEEEVEEEVDDYWCDKAKNRTMECQNWVTPEDKARLEEERQERIRKWKARNNQQTEEIFTELDLDAPIEIEKWKVALEKERNFGSSESKT